eukprot:gene10026-2345_t
MRVDKHEFWDIVELKDDQHPLLAETVQLYKQNFPESYEMESESIIELLKAGLIRILVSVKSNQVSACAIISSRKVPGIYHLDYLFVNKKLQGKGIGSTFLKNLTKFLGSEKNVKALTLECVDGLIKFYEKFNAQKTKLKPTKFNSGLDSAKIFNFLFIPISNEQNELPTDKQLADVYLAIRESEDAKIIETEKYFMLDSTSFVPCK